jgi:hypothetical protein
MAAMGEAARQILERLDRLAEAEREEVVAEILRRAASSEHSGPEDRELLEAADRLFLELDRREQS